MGKLLEVWLKLLEGRTWFYPEMAADQIKLDQKRYEEDYDPQPFTDKAVYLMRAFANALGCERPIPEWVINGLNSDKRLQKYRPFPKDEKIEFLSTTEVMGQWDIKDDPVKMARYIWNDQLGYYVISGKWMSEVAQAVRQKEIITYKGNRVHLMADGWTWVDHGEITFDKFWQI